MIKQETLKDFFKYLDYIDSDYEKLTVKDLNKFIKSHTEIENLTFSIVTKKEKE